ncbi:MAG: HAD-IIA family hydrolase [Chloroflexota bacterium]
MNTQINFSKIRAVLLDMDGVVYVGEQPLPGVQDFMDFLEGTGRQWLCLTNNSSKTPPMFVEKLERMQVRSKPENVLDSSQATAKWMIAQYPNRGTVLPIGHEGLRVAMQDAGFTLTDRNDEADFVVAGIDFDMTYAKMEEATLAIHKGATFIGTNDDPTFPSEKGQVPGAGSILAMIQTTTGVEPIVIGKPNAGMFEQALSQLGVTAEETMMVGDRYETDIIGAIELGMITVGVLTGVTTAEQFAAYDHPPDIVLHGLPDLLDLWKRVEG